MANAKRNYLLIVEGSDMEPSIFEYVFSQYGFSVVRIPRPLGIDSVFTKMELSNDRDTIFIIQGPKNRVKDLIDNEVDINLDSLSRKFFEPDVYFAGIFLVYDTDHNSIDQLENAYDKFNDTSEGLLILSVPCIESLGEFDFDNSYDDKSFDNYKKRLNQYYHDKYRMNTKEFIQCNFNKLILKSLIRNKDIFEKENKKWEVDNVVMHPKYLLETYKKYNNCIGNCEENYEVHIKYFSTIFYVIIAYVKQLEREFSNYSSLKKYLEQIEYDNKKKIIELAKILVAKNITTIDEFVKEAKIENFYAEYLFLIFEEKGIISNRIKGQGRRILANIQNIESMFDLAISEE